VNPPRTTGAAALTAVLVLSACTGEEDEPTGPPDATSTSETAAFDADE